MPFSSRTIMALNQTQNRYLNSLLGGYKGEDSQGKLVLQSVGLEATGDGELAGPLPRG